MHLSEEVRLLTAKLKAADDKAQARLAQVQHTFPCLSFLVGRSLTFVSERTNRVSAAGDCVWFTIRCKFRGPAVGSVHRSLLSLRSTLTNLGVLSLSLALSPPLSLARSLSLPPLFLSVYCFGLPVVGFWWWW